MLEPIHISQSTVDSLKIFYVFYVPLENRGKLLATDFKNLFSILKFTGLWGFQSNFDVKC